MPVYEYFCPHCSRELEILRPIESAGDYSDCPYCGGKAWRLLSGFGSKTGSYLQPSGEPFRAESGWRDSEREIVATVAKSDTDGGYAVEEQRESSAEMSWLLESQPNGSNIWFVQDWGIAPILRYLREDLNVGLAEVAVSPVEKSVEPSAEVDQGSGYASARPSPDDRMEEPATAAESLAVPADVPIRAEKRAVEQSRELAVAIKPRVQATRVPARQWLPRSYFGWFVLMLACTAAIVVLVVWILTLAT